MTGLRRVPVCAIVLLPQLLLLMATVANSQPDRPRHENRWSDEAITCKQSYRELCLPEMLHRPIFKNPICVKHSRGYIGNWIEDYYTYPKGACGYADLCWNPTLELVKNDVCDHFEPGPNSNCRQKRMAAKYELYRRRAEKLPSPRSGNRKVRYLFSCSTPYDCAMLRHPGCYSTPIVTPDRRINGTIPTGRPDNEWRHAGHRRDIDHTLRDQWCYRFYGTKKGLNVQYVIWFTYTKRECIEQDLCWERFLEPVRAWNGEVRNQKHCSRWRIEPGADNIGRIRYRGRRPHIFGGGR